MRLRALAKINLGLDIVGKRPDGYHEVRMIMQTIQMYDVLEIEKKEEPGITLTTNIPYVPTDERNLVYKAAKILMDEFLVKEGLSMKLDKFIPVAAGMAGGSFGRSRCSLLRYAWNGFGRGHRREAHQTSETSTLLCAGGKTGGECFHQDGL